jgi:hypothetical protein
MNPERIGLTFVVVLFFAMLVQLEFGRRIRLRHLAQGEPGGLGAIEGALFGLLGLLLAFTFSGAAGRYDSRRQQIVEEANAIGTAYLRLDVVPGESRAILQNQFRSYLETRLAVYRVLPDIEAAYANLARADTLQQAIWSQAVAATMTAPATQPAMLLLPALNQMFDITTVRTAAAQFHPPTMIFVMLGLLVLVCATLAGYGMGGKARSWYHTVGFALVISLTILVIIDLEYPRLGFIQLASHDRVLEDLLARMR